MNFGPRTSSFSSFQMQPYNKINLLRLIIHPFAVSACHPQTIASRFQSLLTMLIYSAGSIKIPMKQKDTEISKMKKKN